MQSLKPDSCAYLLAVNALLKDRPEEDEIYTRFLGAMHFIQRVAGDADDRCGPACDFKNTPHLLRREFVGMRGEMHSCCACGHGHIRAAVDQ